MGWHAMEMMVVLSLCGVVGALGYYASGQPVGSWRRRAAVLLASAIVGASGPLARYMAVRGASAQAASAPSSPSEMLR